MIDHADQDEHTRKTSRLSEWAAPEWSPVNRPPQTPHDHQERHSPSRVTTQTGKASSATSRATPGATSGPETAPRRRIIDARLWAALSPAAQDAAIDIATACETMGRGLGFVISNWKRIPGTSGAPHNIAEIHARMINDYTRWARACHGENISHGAIIDILVMGASCRAVDAARRTRPGFAKRNLLLGLDLYCRLKGWR